MSGWGPFSLAGKNAIVTGGALGIGFGICKWLANSGANVLVADMNEEAAMAAARKLSEGSSKAVAFKADVTQTDAGEQMVAKCVESFGSVDILVNNAGIYPFATMLETTPELWAKVIGVNLTGTAFCAKAAAAQMIKQGKGGKIINIASIDAIHPSFAGLAAYDASKGGVLMFTKNFALEMGPHKILVNAIAPGGIETEGTSGAMTEEMKQGFIAQIPVGRMGQPDDIGKVALFLASSASDYMTGEIVVVDGGRLLG